MKKKSPPRCDIALLVDEDTGEYSKSGRRFIPEDDDVEEKVLRALRRQYRRVEVVPYSRKDNITIDWLRRLAPRIVMNLTEWVDGDRTQDAVIADVLDRLGMRYTGAGPAGLRLARDKSRAKRAVAALGLNVPQEVSLSIKNIHLRFPLLVKPRFGDGSDGITGRSLANNPRELRSRLATLRRSASGPALCEEFIAGRDLYVGLVGNAPRVLPPIELVIGRTGASAPRFATYRLKNDPRYRAKWRAHYRQARLGAGTGRALADASRKIFHALKLRDYARLDFRLAPDGRFWFIEANPNPDLDPYALNRSGCFAGLSYDRLLRTIVESARRRYA